MKRKTTKKPIFKISRRLGFSILESGKEFAKGKKRAYGPGQHGLKMKKDSNYAIQLKEKQKVKFIYGLREKQFQKTFLKASHLSGITGENFLKLLESRLDNLVYRLKFASTRRAARQLVVHGHVEVDGKKVDIPSYIVSVGSKITIKNNFKNHKNIKEALGLPGKIKDFVKLNKKSLVGEYTRWPNRDELSPEINEALVVEWYNKII